MGSQSGQRVVPDMNSEQQRLRFGPVRLAPGISRGNTWALLLASFVVIGTFTVLWATVAGVEQGLTAAEAVRKGALLLALANGAGLLWMPAAPYVLIGVANGVVFVFALIVRMTAPGDVNIRRAQTTPQA